MSDFPIKFKKKAESLIDFVLRNGWTISQSNGGHIKLQHSVAGVYFTSATTGDHRAYLNCRKALERRMRELGLPIK